MQEEFKTINNLGDGFQAVVELVQDKSGNQYAMKKFKPEFMTYENAKEMLIQEFQVLHSLQHENIVKIVDYKENINLDKSYKTCAHQMEYLSGGNFFQYISKQDSFSEKLARTYFHQLLKGVEYMHNQGYCHRDLKLSNIMLDKDFKLKIIDFGFACDLSGDMYSGDGIFTRKVGTKQFMLPEMNENCGYNGEQCDIFALGIIMFVLCLGQKPFQQATKSDQHYKLIIKKNFDQYWKNKNISKDLKELLFSMFAYRSSDRPNIDEIKESKWYKGKILSDQELKKEMSSRKQLI